jgi:hypothetical protein
VGDLARVRQVYCRAAYVAGFEDMVFERGVHSVDSVNDLGTIARPFQPKVEAADRFPV